MVMTTGEFEFDTIFFSDTLDFAVISYILWIIFVILMPVLLTNLLVCICTITACSYVYKLVVLIACICVCVYICVCMYCIFVLVGMLISCVWCMHVCVCVCMYVCVCMCVCVCASTRMHTLSAWYPPIAVNQVPEHGRWWNKRRPIIQHYAGPHCNWRHQPVPHHPTSLGNNKQNVKQLIIITFHWDVCIYSRTLIIRTSRGKTSKSVQIRRRYR